MCWCAGSAVETCRLGKTTWEVQSPAFLPVKLDLHWHALADLHDVWAVSAPDSDLNPLHPATHRGGTGTTWGEEIPPQAGDGRDGAHHHDEVMADPPHWLARPRPPRADMNSLVALGTVAAYGYSLLTTLAPQLLPAEVREVYFEAVGVILTLIMLGRLLEARAKPALAKPSAPCSACKPAPPAYCAMAPKPRFPLTRSWSATRS